MDCNELKNRVIESLTRVIDPETGMSVLRMNLVKELKVTDNGNLSLVFSPSMHACPLGFKLAFDIRNAVVLVEGVKKIDMKVTDFIHEDELNKILAEAGNTIHAGKGVQHGGD